MTPSLQKYKTAPLKGRYFKKTDPKSETSTAMVTVSQGAPRIPFEVLALIWEFVEETEKTPLMVCNLALVCTSFLEFFSSQFVWNKLDLSVNDEGQPQYALYQNSVKNNIWDSDAINDWYHENSETCTTLPSGIWCHRNLLEIVLEKLNVRCAPSKADYAPYADDLLMAGLFVDRMILSDCFACLSEVPRGNRDLVLRVIKKWPKAVKHCSAALLNDREFIKEVVATNSSCLEFLGDYRSDSELVISASRTNVDVLKFAKGAAREDIGRIFNFEKRGKRCGCGKSL